MKKILNLHHCSGIFITNLVLLLLAVSGCRVVYTPTMQNVPLLEEKGDLKLVANIHNLQTAYALSDNFALMANGSYHQFRQTIKDTHTSPHTYKTYRYNLEGAVGYYRPLIEKVTMEVYGGAGFGHVNLHHHPFSIGYGVNPEEHLLLSANTHKVFIQPAIGLSEKIIDLSFSSRLVALQFSNVSTTYSDQQLQDNSFYNLDQHTYLFLEPCYTMRLGLKWVKLQTQLIYSAKLYKQDLGYNPLVLNVSLQFNLSKQCRQQLFR